MRHASKPCPGGAPTSPTRSPDSSTTGTPTANHSPGPRPPTRSSRTPPEVKEPHSHATRFRIIHAGTKAYCRHHRYPGIRSLLNNFGQGISLMCGDVRTSAQDHNYLGKHLVRKERDLDS